jgi:hypothetical protein
MTTMQASFAAGCSAMELMTVTTVSFRTFFTTPSGLRGVYAGARAV